MWICTQDEFYFSFPAGTLEPADPCALFALVLDGQSIFEVGTEIDLEEGTQDQCFTPDDPISPTYRVACCGF